MEMNYLSFCSSEKVFHLILKFIFSGYRILDWLFFFFPRTLEMLFCGSLARMVSAMKSLIFVFLYFFFFSYRFYSALGGCTPFPGTVSKRAFCPCPSSKLLLLVTLWKLEADSLCQRQELFAWALEQDIIFS